MLDSVLMVVDASYANAASNTRKASHPSSCLLHKAFFLPAGSKHFLFFPQILPWKPFFPQSPLSVWRTTHCNMQLPRMWSRRNLTGESPVIEESGQEINPGHSCLGSPASTQLKYTTCFYETTRQRNESIRVEIEREAEKKKKHWLNSNRSEDSSSGFTLHSLSDLNKPINPLQQHSDCGV